MTIRINSPLSAVVQVGQRGTVVIPAEIRRAMELECGSSLLMILTEEGLHVNHVPSDPIERVQWAFQRAYEGKTAEDVEKSLKELRDEWPD